MHSDVPHCNLRCSRIPVFHPVHLLHDVSPRTYPSPYPCEIALSALKLRSTSCVCTEKLAVNSKQARKCRVYADDRYRLKGPMGTYIRGDVTCMDLLHAAIYGHLPIHAHKNHEAHLEGGDTGFDVVQHRTPIAIHHGFRDALAKLAKPVDSKASVVKVELVHVEDPYERHFVTSREREVQQRAHAAKKSQVFAWIKEHATATKRVEDRHGGASSSEASAVSTESLGPPETESPGRPSNIAPLDAAARLRQIQDNIRSVDQASLPSRLRPGYQRSMPLC